MRLGDPIPLQACTYKILTDAPVIYNTTSNHAVFNLDLYLQNMQRKEGMAQLDYPNQRKQSEGLVGVDLKQVQCPLVQ